MDAEELFLRNVATIDRIAGYVCRRNGVRDDEAAEFAAEVHLRLIDKDYAILRKFEGRSALPTYLTTVITRLYHEYRVSRWGKWRPTAEAKRLGDKAITLERMITRDGMTFDEAAQMLTTRKGGTCYSMAELKAIYLRLPYRHARPVAVSEEGVPDIAAVTPDAEARLIAAERERAARAAVAQIDQVIERFAEQDRIILRMRFWEARRVPEIARRLHVDQKKIYKRIDKLLSMLRRALEAAGMQLTDLDALLEGEGAELHVDVLEPSGNRGFRPSHTTSGEVVERGEGGMR